MAFKYKKQYEPDSYDQYADSFFESNQVNEDELFKHVHPADRLEVREVISVAATKDGFDEVADFRVYPIYMAVNFHKDRKNALASDKGGIYASFNRSLRVLSGRVYLYGFSHTA
jgi:hypothetical protein